jgi:hypothetical protein
MFFHHEPITSLEIAATYPIPTYFIWVAPEGWLKRSQSCARKPQFEALVQKLDQCALGSTSDKPKGSGERFSFRNSYAEVE